MSNQFALVSTVDSMPEGFPSHCVILFGTEQEAVKYAADCIAKHDQSVEYYVEDNCWMMGYETWNNAQEFLETWQEALDTTEYFHVMPVEDAV